MDVIVETRHGRIRGVRAEGLTRFRGIPYAAPPRGRLRLRAPQPPIPWTGVREALADGAPAPQRPGELGALLGLRLDAASEDCLALSVTTPDVRGSRPVLVWLHGGGFVSGSASLPVYDAAALARRGDVVVVSVGYRLGALGFLPLLDARGEPTEADEAWASFGLLDQIAALDFVREHADRFGGDPERVVLFGESAGAMAIGTLLAAPRARGRFTRAVLQSGAAENVHDREAAARVSRAFADALGVRPGDRKALAEVPVARMLAAQDAAVAAVWREVRGVPFQPVVDGSVVPEAPLRAIRSGAARGKRLLLGTNRDENRLWSAFDATLDALDEERLLRRCRVRVGAHAERVVADYRARMGPAASPAELWTAIETDRVFRAPADRMARAVGTEAAPFVYLFTRASPALEGRLGACHALEIPFVFGTHRDPRVAPLVGSGAEVDALSESMQDAWLAFARFGEPSPPDPAWPAWSEGSRATRVFGGAGGVERDDFRERAELWDEVLG